MSSNEEVFKNSTKIHQEALEASGYDFKLKFEKQDLDALNSKKRRSMKRRIYWLNPPYDMNVATEVGKSFSRSWMRPFHLINHYIKSSTEKQ